MKKSWNYVKLESTRTKLKITNLASRESYMCPIYMKILPKIKLSQIRVGLIIAQKHLYIVLGVVYDDIIWRNCDEIHMVEKTPYFTRKCINPN